MKIDTYTKTVLTIIAVCLMALTMDTLGLFPEAHANSKHDLDKTYISVPVNEDGSITVKLAPDEMLDVNIDAVNDRGIFGSAVPVVIED